MVLASAAKRVAAEFEFSGDQIRAGVKEFLKEMGMLKMFPFLTLAVHHDEPTTSSPTPLRSKTDQIYRRWITKGWNIYEPDTNLRNCGTKRN
jgi:hypothetical protein